MNRKSLVIWLSLSVLTCSAQVPYWFDNDEPSKLEPLKGLEYRTELQATGSHGKTPLWLNANKQGLSSLERYNGYLRGAVIRPLQTDSIRRWGVGYGVDVAVPYHFTSKVVVQQAFAEARWLHGVLSVGAKEYPMELKNNALSSGSQTLGINARPVPQVRLALGDYWTIPYTKGWLHMKGHIAYGRMTDEGWQHDFTRKQSKYADGLLYHSKAGYLKLSNEERFFPLSLEVGLEMAAQFNGTAYSDVMNGTLTPMKGSGLLKGMWHAFFPAGSETSETTYKNVEGNQLGSWMMRVNYDADEWRLGFYADRFFEDHSAMLGVDYDGYGSGDEWEVKKDRRYLFYDLKDIMLGLEFNLKYDRWINDIVVEYLYSQYQSGPVYHDHNRTIADHVGGNDDYYNHKIYPGWQHWGQVIGNPLYRSPIYNENGKIYIENSRMMALHLGIDGRPLEHFQYRVLATYQEGLGTYDQPYLKKHHNASFMVEGRYSFPQNWTLKGAYAMDFGHILGHNAGFQLTLSKSGILK